MINTLAVHGYRSLRELRVPLSTITVVTGANGTGKSSLYRALRLLADCAEGQVVASLAREGGLPSTLWAGPEVIGKAVRNGEFAVQGTTRSGPVSLQLGFAADDFSYLIDLGIPVRRRLGVRSGPGDQAGTGLERRGAAAGLDAGATQTRPGGDPGRPGLAAVRSRPAYPRVDADRGHRPGAGPGAAAGSRAGPLLAVLRPLPHRSRGAGPADPDRHPYPGAAP